MTFWNALLNHYTNVLSYENIIIFGDLNFDMLCAEKSQILNDICDIFNLSQLVKGPTCFKKVCNPSLVDVIITNKKNMCFQTTNSPTGVSDCHNIISTVVKGNLPAQKRREVTYRSYKTFDIDQFTNDLQKIKISENCTEKDLNNIYDEYEKDFKNILDKHAPIKSRYQRRKPLPCMNKELRGGPYIQYTKNRSNKNWEKCRKQRNLVTKIKRKSMKVYFLERCSGGSKSCEFWKTVKPFFSKKGNCGEQFFFFLLFENDKIVNNPNEVSNHFNIFFSTVANKIGIDAVYDSSNHQSIKEILNNREQVSDFEFNKVTIENVDNILNKINIKKAIGGDGILAKIVKNYKSYIAPQLTALVNLSIENNCFPDKLKEAQVTPIFKKRRE